MKEWENCENCKRRVIFTSISDEDMHEHELNILSIVATLILIPLCY